MIALVWQVQRRAPTWTQVIRACRLEDEPRRVFVARLHSLRRSDFVTFTDDEPGTLQLTAKGYRAALSGRGRRDP